MNKKLTAVILIVFAAALTRLFPHAPNFTPIGAMALFAGAYITNRWLAFGIPVLAMLLGDALMGFNGWAFAEQTIMVYLTYMAITFLGTFMQRNKSVVRVAGMSLASSVLFFVSTNLFVWIGGFFHKPELYTLNLQGLTECYLAAIPFFDKTILSDLFYNAVLFGGFYLLQINIPQLQEQKA